MLLSQLGLHQKCSMQPNIIIPNGSVGNEPQTSKLYRHVILHKANVTVMQKWHTLLHQCTILTTVRCKRGWRPSYHPIAWNIAIFRRVLLPREHKERICFACCSAGSAVFRVPNFQQMLWLYHHYDESCTCSHEVRKHNSAINPHERMMPHGLAQPERFPATFRSHETMLRDFEKVIKSTLTAEQERGSTGTDRFTNHLKLLSQVKSEGGNKTDRWFEIYTDNQPAFIPAEDRDPLINSFEFGWLWLIWR